MSTHSGRIVVIGTGIAGLCAAVYARRCGYEIVIVEQHSVAGGLATSWRRGDFTFETCLRWLLGSNPESKIHERWREVFDIDALTFVEHAELARLETEQGESLVISTDLDRLEADLLRVAPQETAEIRAFVSDARSLDAGDGLQFAAEHPPRAEALCHGWPVGPTRWRPAVGTHDRTIHHPRGVPRRWCALPSNDRPLRTVRARQETPMSTTKQTARLAGIAYLGLLISGVLGFLVIRSQLVVPGDAVATAANLVENELLARLGIAADLTIVLTQSLAALYFFKLFRDVNSFAAASLAAFGFMNSAAILVATAFSATALQLAVGGASSAPDTVLLMYDLNGALWDVAALFFGLWLIPMGWLVLRSGFMPAPLGWLVIAGGIAYSVSAYLMYLLPSASVVTDALPILASVGEVWMIGYLVIIGVRSSAEVHLPDGRP